MSRKVTPAAKFCKVCKDAGLPERHYKDHNVKNEYGQVCCPTLKDTCCMRCSKLGHTEKYCKVTVLVTHKKASPEVSKKENNMVNAKSKNMFGSLSDSDSDDDDLPANITMRRKVSGSASKVVISPSAPTKVFVSRMKRDWADFDSDDE